MAATNIFYRIPSQKGTRVATLAGSDCTLHQFCNYIIDSEGLNRNYFIVASGTKVFRSTSCSLQSINLQNNSHVDIIIPLVGGKGGFGSLLRAIGAQIEKTTNRDACRDLSGRRLRDVKREEELKKLLALKDKLEEEKKRRRKEKLEKLKKKCESSTASKSIQELVAMFDDHAYNKRRLEIDEILDVAVDKGIINFKKRQLEASASDERSKKLRLENDSESNGGDSSSREDKPSTAKKMIDSDSNRKEQRSQLETTKAKQTDLWLGLEEEEDDDDDDDDDDDENDDEREGKKSIVTVQ